MGCGTSAVANGEGDTLLERINKGLDEVKGNLVAQLGDQKMMLEVMKALITYISKETQNPEFKTFFGYSLMGISLMSSKAAQNYPVNMGLGILSLSKPESLCYADCEKNFASRSAIIEQIRKAAKSMVDAVDGEKASRAKMGYLLGGKEGAEEDDEPSEDEGSREVALYAKNKTAMLSVLEPFCDILQGLMSKSHEALKHRFLKVTELTDEDLKDMRQKFGLVTAVVKVFSPADRNRDLKLLAFVGPESYGKSTLINHIVGRGVDSDIMPSDAGMGTQVVCKVAPGPFESCKLASDKQGSQVNVKDMLAEVNQTMKAKSEKGELGIRDMDMILVQKDFHTPGMMEFLDVPGIKESTAFHTSLALSMATTLVLVCGKVEYLMTQLGDGGDLQLLRDIVKGLDEPIPIQCVASFKVPKAYFNKNKQNYVKLLNDKFPKCDIREPLWLDFKAQPGMSKQEKEMAVDVFMTSAATGLKRVIDPYKKFVECQDDFEKLSTALHRFLEQDLLTYKKQHDDAMGDLSDALLEYNSADAKKIEAGLTSSLDNAQDILTEVHQVNDLTKFAISGASEVMNPVMIAQALLVDCRLAEMNWLLTQGRDLHEQSFGQLFSSVGDMCGVSEGVQEQQERLHKVFMERVSQSYQHFNTQDDGRLNKDQHMQYWMKECCCKIANYLDVTPFTWFITGFYIVVGDSKNKHALISQIQKRKVYPKTWSFKEKMSVHLKNVSSKAGDWVQQCTGKKGDELMEKQFEVMEASCNAFREIADQSRFFDSVRDNDCMEELLEFVYVMAERILCKKKTDDSVWVWTNFAKWLKKNADGPQELKAKNSELSKAAPGKIPSLCTDTFKLMKNSACSIPEWKQKLEQEIPDKLDKLNACSKRMQVPQLTPATSAALLISYSTKEVLTSTSGFFGGDTCAFPDAAELFKKLTSNKACQVQLQDAPGPNLEESFTMNAFDLVTRTGSRVAMYMRRPDTQTYDPLDRERVMLEKLATQPNLTHLFVLWAPSQEQAWNIDKCPKWDISRGKIGSYLKVEIVETREKFDTQDFIENSVVAAMKEADEVAKANFEKLERDLSAVRNDFKQDVSEFINAMDLSMHLTPAAFHDALAGELRNKNIDLSKKFKIPKSMNKLKFQVPSKAFLLKVPEFRDKGIDRITVDDAKGSGKETVQEEVANELLARAFLFNVMLGQIVNKSTELAGLAHEKLISPLLDEIGAKFFMSGGELLAALGKYVAQQEKKNLDGDAEAEELRNMRMLREMLDVVNFQHMYVGCVVYMLMPALYSTVIPKVYDQDAADASDKGYKEKIARAKSMIGEQDQWDQFCKTVGDIVKPYSPW